MHFLQKGDVDHSLFTFVLSFVPVNFPIFYHEFGEIYGVIFSYSFFFTVASAVLRNETVAFQHGNP